NKYSVMGVYGDTVQLSVPPKTEWPIGFRVGFFLRFDVSKDDPEAFKFEFKVFSKGKDVAGFAGGATRPPGVTTGIIALPVVAPAIPIEGSGELHFRLRILDSAGKELLVENLSPITVTVTAA